VYTRAAWLHQLLFADCKEWKKRIIRGWVGGYDISKPTLCLSALVGTCLSLFKLVQAQKVDKSQVISKFMLNKQQKANKQKKANKQWKADKLTSSNSKNGKNSID
jgi:hypothetical protein